MVKAYTVDATLEGGETNSLVNCQSLICQSLWLAPSEVGFLNASPRTHTQPSPGQVYGLWSINTCILVLDASVNHRVSELSTS